MRRTIRLVLAAILALGGGSAALLFGGGGVAMCLGPLGVTPIQCAKATGLVSTIGIGGPLFAAVLAGALLLAVGIPRVRLGSALLVGVVAAGLGAIAFVALWPSRWEGFDSAGNAVSIERPLDSDALLLVAILAGAAGALGVAHVIGPIRDRLGRRGSAGF